MTISIKISAYDISIIDRLQDENKLHLKYVNTEMLSWKESRVVWNFFDSLNRSNRNVNVYSGIVCPDYNAVKKSVQFSHVVTPDLNVSFFDRICFRQSKVIALCNF